MSQSCYKGASLNSRKGFLLLLLYRTIPFIGNVQEVGIHGERRLPSFGLWDRDSVCLCIGQKTGSAVEVPFAPGCNDLDVWLEGIVAQLKADLIVSLAGGAMRDGIGAHLACDFDLALGDERASDAGAQQVHALVERICPDTW